MPGVSSCCHLEKIWSLSPLRSLMFSQKSDVLSSPFPFSMLLYLLLPCLTAPRPGFKWGWIFDHPSSMLPWEAWSGLWIGFVYTAPMWRLLCESSQSILSKNRSSAPPSGPFIIDVLWKKRGGIFFFFFIIGILGKTYSLTVNTRAPFSFDHWGGLPTGLWFLVYVGNWGWNS